MTELTAAIRDALETRFAEVWLEGEISNCRLWNTGHLYFTLKDRGAQIKAVMFRSAHRRLRFKPDDGLHVLARGAVDLSARLRGEDPGALPVLLGGRQQRQLRQRDHLDDRHAAGSCPTGPVGDQLAGPLALAAELGSDPADHARHREPGAVARERVAGDLRRSLHLAQPVAGKRAVDHRQSGDQGAVDVGAGGEQLPGEIGPVLGVVPLAAGEMGVGDRQAEVGVAGGPRGARPPDPPFHRQRAAARQVERDRRPDEPAGAVEIAGVEREADRPPRFVLRRPPGGGPAVELRHLLGMAATELAAQHLGEQRVHPEPLVAAVERDQQHVPPRQLGQPRGRVVAVEQRVAELPAEAVEDRGAEEEVDVRFRRVREELVPHVVDQLPLVTGEAGEGVARSLAQREAGQVERRRPALGLLDQRPQLGGTGAQAGLGEQLPGLARRHREVG
ncbi:MAG: exodeoxyribonuclease VII large subunit [Syntrophothermus sp.]